jgi:hypothetical protein
MSLLTRVLFAVVALGSAIQMLRATKVFLSLPHGDWILGVLVGIVPAGVLILLGIAVLVSPK